jgi:hypothetical protein
MPLSEVKGEAIQLQAFHVLQQQGQRVVHTGVEALAQQEQNFHLRIIAIKLLAEFGQLILTVVFNV